MSRKKDVDEPISRLSEKKLVNMFLCKKDRSGCYTGQGCVNLDVCRYGQRAVEIRRQNGKED